MIFCRRISHWLLSLIGGSAAAVSGLGRQAGASGVDAARADAHQPLESGQPSGKLTHDLNNLLGIIICNLDLARDMVPEGSDAAGPLQAAHEAALRGAELNRRLLALARGFGAKDAAGAA